MSHQEQDYWIAFSVFSGIGPVRFSLLLKAFGDAKTAWEASIKQLQEIGLSSLLLDRFIAFRRTFSIDSYITLLQKKNIRTVCKFESTYPSKLAEIVDAPSVLYIVGTDDLTLLSDSKLIGIVGTRKIDRYGIAVTKQITIDLCNQHCSIVSGLALGADGVAHETALSMGCKTIAVLGCGVDIIAPSSHEYLYKKIRDGGGLIISEVPLGHRPTKGLFPARNRIISGLCRGIVVTQGAKESGSLITARYAAEQGREVFAIPGDVTSSLSDGPHELIRQGATLVTNGTDIVMSLGLTSTTSSVHTTSLLESDSYEDRTILLLLSESPQSIDSLIQHVSFPIAIVSQRLTFLELSGRILRDLEGIYRLT